MESELHRKTSAEERTPLVHTRTTNSTRRCLLGLKAHPSQRAGVRCFLPGRSLYPIHIDLAPAFPQSGKQAWHPGNIRQETSTRPTCNTPLSSNADSSARQHLPNIQEHQPAIQQSWKLCLRSRCLTIRWG